MVFCKGFYGRGRGGRGEIAMAIWVMFKKYAFINYDARFKVVFVLKTKYFGAY